MKRNTRSSRLSPFTVGVPLCIFLVGLSAGLILLALLLPDSAFDPPPSPSSAPPSTASAPITCDTASSLSWRDEVISSQNTAIGAGSGIAASMALDAVGEPFIAFATDDSAQALWMSRRSGATWTEAEIDVRKTQKEFQSVSAALVDAQPAVAYGIIAPIRFLIFAQWNGTGWEIEDLEYGGNSAAMAVSPDGRPHIVHFNTTESLRLYIRNASSTWIGQTVVEGRFETCAITFLGTAPAIGYYEVTNPAPPSSDFGAYVWNGTDWNGFVVETIATTSAAQVSVTTQNDTLIMVYDRPNMFSLGYAELDGDTWTTEEAIPGTGSDLMVWASIKVICDRITAIYCIDTLPVRCSIATRSANTTWFVDATYDGVMWFSAATLIDFDGYPAAAIKSGEGIDSILTYVEASPV